MFYGFLKSKKGEKNFFFSNFRYFENCYVRNLKDRETRITLLQIKKHYTFFISNKPNLRYRVNRWLRCFGRSLFARVQWTNRWTFSQKKTFHFLVQGLIKLLKKPHSKIFITFFTVKFQKTLQKMAVTTEDPLKK